MCGIGLLNLVSSNVFDSRYDVLTNLLSCLYQIKIAKTIIIKKQKTTYRNSTGGEKSISMSLAIQPMVVVKFIYEKNEAKEKKSFEIPETYPVFSTYGLL